MSVAVITPPPFEPITLAEAKLHLRVDDYPGSPGGHPDDVLIQRCITAARERAEEITRRSFVQQTLRMALPGWPPFDSWSGVQRWSHCRIDLLRPPVLRIERIRYYDSENLLATLPESDYFLQDLEPVQSVRFSESFDAPCTYRRDDAVTIDYVAGYSPSGSPAEEQQHYAANVPKTILQGMLLLIGDMYEHREATIVGTITSTLPAADALFESSRILRV